MSVVAAAVHYAFIARAEAEAVLLRVFHAVHIGAEGYRAVCALGIVHRLEAGSGEHPQLVRLRLLYKRFYVFMRLMKLKADLGYSVQISSDLHAVVLHIEYLFAYLH